MGIRSIDLMGPNEWPTLKKYGLTCAMATGAGMGIDKGFNRVELHDKLVEGFEYLIPKAADAGLENVICMSGNRAGLDDEQGLINCAKGRQTAHEARRRKEGQRGHGVVEQQGQPQGLPVRPHGMGRGAVPAAWAPSGSNSSTTSITCRSWKAT